VSVNRLVTKKARKYGILRHTYPIRREQNVDDIERKEFKDGFKYIE
jgi:hypothetical protein